MKIFKKSEPSNLPTKKLQSKTEFFKMDYANVFKQNKGIAV